MPLVVIGDCEGFSEACHGCIVKFVERQTFSIAKSYMDCHAWIVMHGLSCMDCHAWIVMHGLSCMDCHAWIVMHGLSCMDCHAWIVMHGLSCMDCHT